MNGIYKIAACPIEVRSLHRKVHRLCRDYLCEEMPEITVETAQADIEYERERSLAEDHAEGRVYAIFCVGSSPRSSFIKNIARSPIAIRS